jgi:hypothetical protein
MQLNQTEVNTKMSTEKFKQKHGDVLQALPGLRSYKQLSSTGRVIEAWEKNKNDEWVDVTLREQELQRLQEEVKTANKELKKLQTEVTTNEQENN